MDNVMPQRVTEATCHLQDEDDGLWRGFVLGTVEFHLDDLAPFEGLGARRPRATANAGVAK